LGFKAFVALARVVTDTQTHRHTDTQTHRHTHTHTMTTRTSSPHGCDRFRSTKNLTSIATRDTSHRNLTHLKILLRKSTKPTTTTLTKTIHVTWLFIQKP